MAPATGRWGRLLDRQTPARRSLLVPRAAICTRPRAPNGGCTRPSLSRRTSTTQPPSRRAQGRCVCGGWGR
eukprot:7132086-Alexandrium_andersonii.AAC.1